MEINRFVFKKKLNPTELLQWEIMIGLQCKSRSYYIMNFKNTNQSNGSKGRIRVYLSTLDFQKEKKNNIQIVADYIPQSWTLLKQLKYSKVCNHFSSNFHRQRQTITIKRRTEYYSVHPNARVTLDNPTHCLEIKTSNIKDVLDIIKNLTFFHDYHRLMP